MLYTMHRAMIPGAINVAAIPTTRAQNLFNSLRPTIMVKKVTVLIFNQQYSCMQPPYACRIAFVTEQIAL